MTDPPSHTPPEGTTAKLKRHRRKDPTVAEFVISSLTKPAPPSGPKPQLPPKPRQPGMRAGIWTSMTPEERTAHAKLLASKRNSANMARPGSNPAKHTPNGWHYQAYLKAVEAATTQATALVEHLKATGAIDPQDTEALRSTLEALTIVKSPGGGQKRLQAARQLLRQYHPDLAGMV